MGNTATSSFDYPSPRSSSLDAALNAKSPSSLHHRRHSSLLHIQRVAALDSSEADILDSRHVNPLSPPRKSRLSFSRRNSLLAKRVLGKVLGVKKPPEGIELTETELL